MYTWRFRRRIPRRDIAEPSAANTRRLLPTGCLQRLYKPALPPAYFAQSKASVSFVLVEERLCSSQASFEALSFCRVEEEMAVSGSSFLAILMMFGLIIGSAFSQAPGSAPSAAPTLSPPRSAPSPRSTPPASAPSPVSKPPASSPSPSTVVSPPAPPALSPVPTSSPTGSPAPSIANPPSGSPSGSPAAAPGGDSSAALPVLSRVAFAGSVVSGVFATMLLF